MQTRLKMAIFRVKDEQQPIKSNASAGMFGAKSFLSVMKTKNTLRRRIFRRVASSIWPAVDDDRDDLRLLLPPPLAPGKEKKKVNTACAP